jgi:menaquinone-specific isochorismate synthase
VLPRWQLLQVPDSWRSLAVARLNLEIDPESDLAALAGQITAFFAQMERLSRSPLPLWELQAPVPVEVEEAALLGRIQKALQAIRAGFLEKVVLAEAVDLHLPASPSIPPLLAYLEKDHPDCSIFAFAAGVSGPKSLEADARGNLPARPLPLVQEGAFPQVFLGATPERLLSVWQGRVQIDALAGSAARGATPVQDRQLAEELLRSAKDRREHEWVVRSIQEALGRLGMDPCISPQPRLLRLANIQHLQTLIEAELPADVHLFDLLAQLHPTAAVGGYPQQAALQWLERLEPFDRSSYAAPLGWVDLQGNGEFVVGIRSALIRGNWARLYAGAGIVADSNPEQELAEIRLKLRSLVQALALRPAAPPLPSF